MAVSQRTFEVLARCGATGVAVSEREIRDAQRWAVRHLNLVIEPGGAVALAALLSERVEMEDGMLVILSGGNVDPEAFARVLSGTD